MKTSESELAFVLLTGLASNDLLLTRADTRRTTRAAADRDNLIKREEHPRAQKQIFRSESDRRTEHLAGLR